MYTYIYLYINFVCHVQMSNNIYIYIYKTKHLFILKLYFVIQIYARHRLLKFHRKKMGVIYMQSWQQCALPFITTMALWQLILLNTCTVQLYIIFPSVWAHTSHCGNNEEGTLSHCFHDCIYRYIHKCIHTYINTYII